ncbi:MAG: hypothetical protein AAB425_09590 [Bdellovibrionota bacterium]
MNAGNSRGPGGSATRGQQINADNANPAYVAKLRADVETAETELQAVQNQLALYDPKRIDKIRQENVDLEKRIRIMADAYFSVVVRASGLQRDGDATTRSHALRGALITFCNENKYDKKLWKELYDQGEDPEEKDDDDDEDEDEDEDEKGAESDDEDDEDEDDS